MLKQTAQIFCLKLCILDPPPGWQGCKVCCPAAEQEHLERYLQRGESITEGKIAVRPH